MTADENPISDIRFNIKFDRVPKSGAVGFAYAPGSKSGPTGETIFDYVVTNTVRSDRFAERFQTFTELSPGVYLLRVFAVDIFLNETYRDLIFEVY
ncbi:MAG: hypothetical protein LC734_04970 [Acidobacteria bacterium]|nr:hypothetical protein [Acidobacteriota bacterium]